MTIEVAAGVAEITEIADPRLRCRHGVDEDLPARFLQTGVIGEEERPAVPVVDPRDDDGATHCAAKLMAIERRLGILLQPAIGQRYLPHEKVARIERVVAQILEHGSVQHVGSRLGRDRHDAGAAAELRGEHAGQHLEFADLLD